MKRIFNIVALTGLLISCGQVFAARTDTIETNSPSMSRKIKAVVITPDSYASGKQFPVVYLLHGYGGNYADWTRNVPELAAMADLYSMMVVCPDGNTGSWYFDSPIDDKWKFETYVSGELVSWIDRNYKTIKDRTGRAITGLSMGGHGALYLAFRHQDVFGAAGSMSGGVDIRPFPQNWDLAKRLGSYAEHPQRWEENTVVNLTHLLTPGSLSLIIDCGTEDFFFRINENLHHLLLERNIRHDYITRPGGHNWAYWDNAIRYQLLFMHDFFSKK